MSRTILIFDSSYLIFRSFYIHQGLNSGDTPTGAIFGFISTVFQLSKKYNTHHIVFAQDLPAKTWRHEAYEGYKAGRPELAPELATQFPIITEWMKAVTPNVLSKEGYEADDIIKTVCELALMEDEDTCLLIFSSDRDLYQLFVYPHISFIHKNELFDVNQFQEKYGVTPFQWVDLKAYVGDASDNLKGVDGIGLKTAAKLLNHGITIEVLKEYRNLGSHNLVSQFIDIKPSSHEKLLDKIMHSFDQVLDTFALASLHFVDDIRVDLHTPIQFQNASHFYKQYGLNSILRQVGQDTAQTQKHPHEQADDLLLF